jgi:hypothetical protein
LARSLTSECGAADRFAYAEADPLSNTGERDFACAMKKYRAELAVYTPAMDQRDRGSKRKRRGPQVVLPNIAE